jgi:uncharacterized protein YcfL
MRAKLLLPFIVVATLFISCQQEIIVDLSEQVLDDTTLLARLIELDTTQLSGSDTTWQVRYSYDRQKRVKLAVYIYHYGPVGLDVERVEHFYIGSNTLPYKTVATWKEREYQSPGMVPPDFVSTPAIIAKTLTNGNIITQDNPPGFQFGDRDHQLRSYDNSINPFYKAEIPYPVLYRLRMEKNNTLEDKLWDDPANMSIHYQYAYTYRADGYPLIVWGKDMLDPSRGSKGIYIYTK